MTEPFRCHCCGRYTSIFNYDVRVETLYWTELTPRYFHVGCRNHVLSFRCVTSLIVVVYLSGSAAARPVLQQPGRRVQSGAESADRQSARAAVAQSQALLPHRRLLPNQQAQPG